MKRVGHSFLQSRACESSRADLDSATCRWGIEQFGMDIHYSIQNFTRREEVYFHTGFKVHVTK